MASGFEYERCRTPPSYDATSSLPDIQQVDSTHTSVVVQCKRPFLSKASKGTFSYVIKYRNEDGSDKWNVTIADSSKNEFEITCLKPNNSYLVIIAVVDDDSGCSEKLYEIIARTDESLAEKLLCFGKNQQQTEQKISTFKMTPVKEETIANGVNILSFIEAESMNREKNIVLVGPTGAGKTTLVNALFNYLAGVVPTDDFRFQITDECKNADQTKSQKETTTCYSIPKTQYLSNKCSLNIIDTPGFGDTDGKDVQMRIIKQVNALLTTRISTLDAICIVLPLSVFQLTEWSGIFELFAHDVSDIIYCLCTFDDGGKDHVLKALNDANIRPRAHFRFCNSDFFDKISDDMKDDVQKRWLKHSLNFKSFLDHIYRSDGISVKLTREVLTGEETLQMQLKGMRVNVNKSAHKIVNLRQEFKLLNKNKVKLNRGDHFEYNVEEEKHFYARISHQKSCLNCKKCERTCHDNCWAKFEIFYWTCAVFKSGLCTVCKCVSKDHVNEYVIYRTEYEKIIKIDEDLKKKFAMVEEAKEKLKNELREIDNAINKIRDCITMLKYTALRSNPYTIADYIDKLYREELGDKKPGYEDRADILGMLKENIDCMEPAMKLLD